MELRRTQEERSASTRARLLDATVETLIDSGYAGTTTTLVCARAGLSRGAQLHHFPTRANLLVNAVAHLAQRRADEIRRELRAAESAGDPLANALDALRASFGGPLFYAVLELWIAARNDAELRKCLVRFERAVARSMNEVWREHAPKATADSGRLQDMLELSFHVIRGMALQRILKNDDSERRRLFEVWKRMVAVSLDENPPSKKESTR